jgi:hypothetical protein
MDPQSSETSNRPHIPIFRGNIGNSDDYLLWKQQFQAYVLLSNKNADITDIFNLVDPTPRINAAATARQPANQLTDPEKKEIAKYHRLNNTLHAHLIMALDYDIILSINGLFGNQPDGTRTLKYLDDTYDQKDDFTMDELQDQFRSARQFQFPTIHKYILNFVLSTSALTQ